MVPQGREGMQMMPYNQGQNYTYGTMSHTNIPKPLGEEYKTKGATFDNYGPSPFQRDSYYTAINQPKKLPEKEESMIIFPKALADEPTKNNIEKEKEEPIKEDPKEEIKIKEEDIKKEEEKKEESEENSEEAVFKNIENPTPNLVNNEEEEESLSSLHEDEEEDQEANVKDYLLAQYTDVKRIKNKWKVKLKDGILHLKDKEYAFKTINGELERDW
ncbi:MAG: hypothetical protein MJ252_09370 [archaeon]|nr:hypothetical protein [archaeon]